MFTMLVLVLLVSLLCPPPPLQRRQTIYFSFLNLVAFLLSVNNYKNLVLLHLLLIWVVPALSIFSPYRCSIVRFSLVCPSSACKSSQLQRSLFSCPVYFLFQGFLSLLYTCLCLFFCHYPVLSIFDIFSSSSSCHYCIPVCVSTLVLSCPFPTISSSSSSHYSIPVCVSTFSCPFTSFSSTSSSHYSLPVCVSILSCPFPSSSSFSSCHYCVYLSVFPSGPVLLRHLLLSVPVTTYIPVCVSILSCPFPFFSSFSSCHYCIPVLFPSFPVLLRPFLLPVPVTTVYLSAFPSCPILFRPFLLLSGWRRVTQRCDFFHVMDGPDLPFPYRTGCTELTGAAHLMEFPDAVV
jgi:hypothetical protein